MQYLKDEFKAILKKHGMWLNDEGGGSRANLHGADLSRANLYGANLSEADLSRADLSGANLSGADLYGASLSGANLSGANLYGANLSRANLSGANLSGADLSGANLYGANLSEADLSRASLYGADLSRASLYGANLSRANLYGANLSRANLSGEIAEAYTLITPEGSLIGWKKCRNNVIVKVRIPEDARRSNATGRKCRAEFVDVLEVFNGEEGVSAHDGETTYRSGERVACDVWCENRWEECAGGIHFFLTRYEAEQYN